MIVTSYNHLSIQHRASLRAAEAAMREAYKVHGGFVSGAALLGSEGKISTGVNAKNAVYGSSFCAERLIMLGLPTEETQDSTAIAMIAMSGDGKKEDAPIGPFTPCGVCRQEISNPAKFGGHDLEIIMSNTDMSVVWISKISELSPYPFGITFSQSKKEVS